MNCSKPEFRDTVLALINDYDPEARARIEKVLRSFDSGADRSPFETHEHIIPDGVILLRATREMINREDGVYCYNWHAKGIE